MPAGAALLLDGDRIADWIPAGETVTGADVVDLSGLAVAPGFIDLHFHGELIAARGPAFADALARRCAAAPRHGTTAFLATTIATPAPALAELVEGWSGCIAEAPSGGATPLGIHLEGPWIRPEAAGAQPDAGIRPFDAQECDEILARAGGAIRMVTLAPELEGAGQLLARLGAAGVVASVGHSLAGHDALERSIHAGLTHATHVFNAMGPMHHRRPGLALRVLDDDRLSADLICDGVHVDPVLVRAAAAAKRELLCLVTDQVTGGAFPGVRLVEDGGAWRLGEGGPLAGSSLELDRACANACGPAGLSREAAVRACTLAPARVLGIESQRGTLRRGARADLVALDGDAVRRTWVGGRLVHDASGPAA